MCWVQKIENLIQGAYYIVTVTFEKYQETLVTILIISI